MRVSRRWLAALMILGFTSAQAISLARACGTAADAPHATAEAVAAVAMPADCPAMPHAAAPASADCAAHCLPSAQVDKGAEVRIPALAPASALVVRLGKPGIPASALALPPLARIASPPLSLLFGRFLI